MSGSDLGFFPTAGDPSGPPYILTAADGSSKYFLGPMFVHNTVRGGVSATEARSRRLSTRFYDSSGLVFELMKSHTSANVHNTVRGGVFHNNGDK